MALFRPITTPDDLPTVGTSRESGTFDFKQAPSTLDHREMAKDVAAFANALGGVVLVGTVEDRTRGTLGVYKPVAEAEAEALKKAYELAVAQRCLPQPVIYVVRIDTAAAPAVNAAGNVVAVNVYPMPMGPVGVRWDADAYAFPLRTATQTTWMKPTELAMLMVPEIRRVAILLDGIPIDQRDHVWLYSYTPARSTTREAKVLGVDSLLTTLRISIAGPDGPSVTAVPLDRVRSIWQRSDDAWCITVEGSFEKVGNGMSYYPG